MIKRNECSLRLITETDLDQLLSWRNSERIRANMYSDHIISKEEHLKWFKSSKTDPTRKHLVFEYRSTPVGSINITRIDNKSQRCIWGFYLGENGTPPGCGLAMGYLGLEYIFEILRIRKLCGEAFAFNIPSIKYHLKLGFHEEGRLIEHIFKNGKYEDIICFALFNNDWRQLKAELGVKCFGDENDG